MEESAADQLPERWREQARQLKGPSPVPTKEEATEDGYTLQTWLEEVYFEEGKENELGSEDIRKVGDLVKTMLRFEPSSRATAQTMLKDPWFGSES